MPLRFLITPTLLIAAALPSLANADAPADQAAGEVIWVDSYDDIPDPRPAACIGNLSAMYCHAADGNVYAVRTNLAPIVDRSVPETAIINGYAPAPSAGGAVVAPRD